uniref:Uncharacterized protein n=1 Tax=Roseihalotalea indica TaxID=2867963 RepID=A0AA49GIT7_9BACT|nr:hypothetical protein K4G66_18875 [Tunicatimonas sp. TK19036]
MTLTDLEKLIVEFLFSHPEEGFTINELCDIMHIAIIDDRQVEQRLTHGGLIYTRNAVNGTINTYSITEYGKIFYSNRFVGQES